MSVGAFWIGLLAATFGATGPGEPQINGDVSAGAAFQRDGRPCRQVREFVMVNGREIEQDKLFCQGSDGRWGLVEGAAVGEATLTPATFLSMLEGRYEGQPHDRLRSRFALSSNWQSGITPEQASEVASHYRPFGYRVISFDMEELAPRIYLTMVVGAPYETVSRALQRRFGRTCGGRMSYGCGFSITEPDLPTGADDRGIFIQPDDVSGRTKISVSYGRVLPLYDSSTRCDDPNLC